MRLLTVAKLANCRHASESALLAEAVTQQLENASAINRLVAKCAIIFHAQTTAMMAAGVIRSVASAFAKRVSPGRVVSLLPGALMLKITRRRPIGTPCGINRVGSHAQTHKYCLDSREVAAPHCRVSTQENVPRPVKVTATGPLSSKCVTAIMTWTRMQSLIKKAGPSATPTTTLRACTGRVTRCIASTCSSVATLS